ncbi:AraC family transcriptional regulator [Lactococcus lactis]|uniref:AraC family transcriptional regulator n=1 Tax=Lactococcus lactis TaxID=1358 RepID=A0A9X4S4K7_9LACT|nr:AraC family transcriptional regulator [Lactococcus lactis]MDG4983783.1 AraC family transcriptional regulator [Lactococcus lactis]
MPKKVENLPLSQMNIKQNIESPTTNFQENYQLEANLFSLFHKQNIGHIKALTQNIINHTLNQHSCLSSNLLIDKKYRLISLITLLTRESVKQGCSAQFAYRLSDRLIFEVDNIENINNVGPILDLIITEFFDLYHTKLCICSHPIVKATIDYIHANTYHNLSNADIADYLSIHPVYLSNLFKKQTDLTLHKYIVNEKISEAKYLLSNTTFTCLEIATILHFSNQSHFCKLFKKYTGFTPKEFRLDKQSF